jgi:outer membrane murein-binding lipoprotein Lpp
MKTQTYITIAAAILLVCFAAGCSTTSDINIRTDLQLDDEEPFMAEIRELATKRDRFYYLGKPIGQGEYSRRVDDMINKQEQFYITSQPEVEPEVVPILLLRF